MSAYSALVSLQQLLNSNEFTLHYPKPLLESLHAKLSLLQSFVEIFPASKRGANKLEAQIRDAVCNAQDSIELSIFTNRTLPSETLQEIIENMDPIIEKAIAGDEYKKMTVGQDEDKKMIVGQLLSDVDRRLVIPITGMPGVGKTTLARSIYEDRHIKDKFPFRAWVTVSQDYDVRDLLAKLLTSIESRGQKAGERVYEGSESSTREKLHQALYNKKYLVVIDDMWDTQVWEKLQLSLPDNENGSRVVVTTRLRGVANSIKSSRFCHEMKPLDNEDSWTLLKQMTLEEYKDSNIRYMPTDDRYRKMIVDQLQSDVDRRLVIPITGMAGIGKTTLARSIYEDPHIKDKFPYRAWVTVPQDYDVRDLLAKLLTSIECRGQKAGERVYEGSESSTREKLHQALYNNKYLVVIDDMWDEQVWNKLQLALPDNENGSRVVVTTRIQDVANSITSSGFIHELKPQHDEDSWTLLKLWAFGNEPCPTHLEKIGRKIAKNCNGLPLSITVIGGLLSQGRKEEDYWQSIADDTYDANVDADPTESYQNILSLSYCYLPAKLKACFLYMAAFPEDTQIPVSKLIKLWVAEGFLTPPPPPQTIERVAEISLLQLIDRNLILIRRNNSGGRIKTCGMHDSLLNLAKKEAEKEKFIYSITTSQTENIEEGAMCHRRVSVHDTILMCRKQVYHSTKSIKYARSLLYIDPHYHYPLPFCLTFDLLRVLDAYTVYHIEFPNEYIKLIHLRYLSLTYNGKLPPSISKLRNLQVLIVRRQPKIIVVGISFLPKEIWDMPQLRHLLFTESELPYPCLEENSPLLENLQTLSNVSAASCTKEVLRNMPNLKKLGMWIDKRGAIGFNLYELNQLESFKFTVLKPIPTTRIEFQPNLFFPETLRKLSLSGCGLPWEYMEVIAGLPHLEVLKLRELAFQGEEWCPTYVFYKLKFLKIEYLDLQRWETDGFHYPRLDHLILRNCYALEGIPLEIGCLEHLELIELVDCSPEAVDAAECIKEEQEDFGNDRLQVRIFSSWE